MKTFSSNSYKLLGFGTVSTPFGTRNCWMFELRPKGKSKHFTPSVEFIEEAKWVQDSVTYFLKRDGVVEGPGLVMLELATL